MNWRAGSIAINDSAGRFPADSIHTLLVGASKPSLCYGCAFLDCAIGDALFFILPAFMLTTAAVVYLSRRK